MIRTLQRRGLLYWVLLGIRIQSSAFRPVQARVAAQYHGRWYYGIYGSR